MDNKQSSTQAAALRPKSGGADNLYVLLALISIVVSGAMALATRQFGLLALLVIPVVIFLFGGLSKPDLALAVFFFITFTQFSEVAISFYHLPSLAQPLAGLLLFIFLVRWTIYGERPLTSSRSITFVLLYILILFVHMLYADNFIMARDSFIGFAKDMLGGVIVVMLVRTPASIKNAVLPIVVAGILMGTISVIQFTRNDFANQYGGFGRWENQVSGETSRNRISGPYANPNAYSQVLIVIVAIALGRLWYEKRAGLKALAGWAVVVCALSVIFTYSRGGFLTLVATIALLFVQNRSRFFPILLTAAVAVAALQFLPTDYTSRLTTLFQFSNSPSAQVTDTSFRGRLSENIAAWQMFWDHPYFGVGLGNFKVQYQEYSRLIGLDTRRVERNPASLYMELLAEQGLIGLSVFAFLMYAVFRGLIIARVQFARVGLHDQAHIAMSVFVALVGYLIAAAAKNSAYANVFWALVGFAISIEQVAYSVAHVEEKPAPSY